MGGTEITRDERAEHFPGAFPGNNVLHVERRAYLSRIGRFIRSTGFGAST